MSQGYVPGTSSLHHDQQKKNIYLLQAYYRQIN